MKQSIIIKPKTSKIVDKDIPDFGDNEVLVRVRACGVCASELHGGWLNGTNYPLEAGHEVAGEVVAVGSAVKNIYQGMRVAGLFSSGFAEYAVARADRVAPIPDGISYDIAAALSEPLSCVVSSTRRTPVEIGDTAAIVGLGFMGLLKLQTILLKGVAKVIAIDVREEALDTARKFGAEESYLPSNVPEEYKLNSWDRLNGDWGVNLAIEASGSQPALSLAVQLPKAHGYLNILGYHQGGKREVDVELLNWKAVTVINGHERRDDYKMDCLRRGLNLLIKDKINYKPLVTHRYGLEEVDRAFEALLNKPDGFIKAVIVID